MQCVSNLKGDTDLEKIKGQSLGVVRNHNLKTVLHFLFKRPYSCFELAELMGISSPAVRKIIMELLNAGVVEIMEPDSTVTKSRGGQPVRYKLRENDNLFMCLDTSNYGDKEKVICRVYSTAGRMLVSESFAAPPVIGTEEIAEIISDIKRLLQQSELDYRKILTINIAVPGQVDKNNGKFILSSRFAKSPDLNLSEVFAHEFGAEVRVMNDTKYAALGAAVNGEFGDKNFIYYVYVGTGGISSVIYSEGSIWTGGFGFSGEIGLNAVPEYGMLHIACVLYEILKRMRNQVESFDMESLFKAYRENPFVKREVLKSAEVLARELCNINNLIGCEMIVLTGEVCEFGEEYLKVVQDYFKKNQKYLNVNIKFSRRKRQNEEGLYEVSIEDLIDKTVRMVREKDKTEI